jgi:hypothetical protein
MVSLHTKTVAKIAGKMNLKPVTPPHPPEKKLPSNKKTLSVIYKAIIRIEK